MEKLKKAFTLAEILITLGIIGIVASLTLSTVIKNNNRKIFAVSLKKFYSQNAQMLQQIRSETGCSDIDCLGLSTKEEDLQWHDNLYKILNSNFKIVKYVKNP